MPRIRRLAPLWCATVLLLTGCASTAPANDTPQVQLLTGTSAYAAFVDITQASCDRARAEGIVEISSAPAFTLVMVPADEAIDGFSAAYQAGSDPAQLIYENDAFVACYLGNTFALLEEGGQQLTESGIESVTQVAGDQWDVTEVDNEISATRTTRYTVEDGVITRVNRPVDSATAQRSLTYGALTDADRQILTDAVAIFTEKFPDN